ncbi:MAG: glutamate cyclase domain-containing protein [candidate division NC10 bacterium]
MAAADPIDQVLALDLAARGIDGFCRPGGARAAARSLARGKRVILTTGFAVGPGMAETDGPPGAAVLGRAARLLGKSVGYVTDDVAAPLMEAALKALGEPVEMVVIPHTEAAAVARERIARTGPPIWWPSSAPAARRTAGTGTRAASPWGPGTGRSTRSS